MKIYDFFKRNKKTTAVQTGNILRNPYQNWLGYTPLATPDYRLYDAIREGVPIIDAAIDKIIRLTDGFEITCTDITKQHLIDSFVENVKVGSTTRGLRQFVTCYLDSLLTYGNAVGEIILNEDQTQILALYNASLGNIFIKESDNFLDTVICTHKGGFDYLPVPNPELILFTPLNPPSGKVCGVSLLRGLPFVSTILMNIFQSINNNFERLGNLRYSVTYKPGSSPIDRANAKDIAESIAEQWRDVMSSQKAGIIKDFVSVGDVDIKVIGADNKFINTEVPVRQILEQIVAKLGVPPFMLGLHWSTSERMSAQQADILTSELYSYRYHLESIIKKICETFLRLNGSGSTVSVKWADINLQDQIEAANARLINAKANELENKNGGDQNSTI